MFVKKRKKIIAIILVFGLFGASSWILYSYLFKNNEHTELLPTPRAPYFLKPTWTNSMIAGWLGGSVYSSIKELQKRAFAEIHSGSCTESGVSVVEVFDDGKTKTVYGRNDPFGICYLSPIVTLQAIYEVGGMNRNSKEKWVMNVTAYTLDRKVMWNRSWQGPAHFTNPIATDAINGSVYIVGNNWDPDPKDSKKVLNNSNFLLEYDASGNLLVERLEKRDEKFSSGTQLSMRTDGIYLISVMVEDSINASLSVRKFDLAWNEIWNQTWHPEDGFKTLYWSDLNYTIKDDLLCIVIGGNSYAYLLQIDGNHAPQSIRIEPIHKPYLDSVLVSERGIYILYTNYEPYSTSRPYYEGLWKYDLSGKLLWKLSFDTLTEGIMKFSEMNDGIYVFGSKIKNNSNESDAWMQKYAQNGDLLWESFWDDGGNETFSQMAIYDARLYLIGMELKMGYGTYEPRSFLMRVDMASPTPPTDLRSETLNGKVKLTWDPSNDSGGIGPARYEVFKGQSGSNLRSYATTGNANAFIDNQTPGKGEESVYAVRAYTPFGNSTLSDTVTVHHPGDALPWSFWAIPVAIVVTLTFALAITFIRRRRVPKKRR